MSRRHLHFFWSAPLALLLTISASAAELEGQLVAELDTYQVLDARDTLEGHVELNAGAADSANRLRLFAARDGDATPTWESTFPLPAERPATIPLDIPLANMPGGYHQLKVELLNAAGSVIAAGALPSMDGTPITFAVREFRAATPSDVVPSYLDFVKNTIDTLASRQSARLGGTPNGTLFLTVTRPVYTSYRSIGHKRGESFENYWFPEKPMDLAPYLCDFDLWPILDRFSELSGEPRYSEMTDAMARGFVVHGFHPSSGLGYLGEEAGFDVARLAVASTKIGVADAQFKPKNTGTFPGMPLARLWAVAPDSMHRMFRAMYLGLVTEPGIMDFNRYCHFNWDDKAGKHALVQNTAHCAFDSAAGRMIHWWANAFAETGDADCLKWAEQMTDKWAAVQHPESGLVPNFFGAVAAQENTPMPPGEWAEARNAALTAVALLDAADELNRREAGKALATRLTDMARRMALGVARFSYDPERRVFREYLHLDGKPFTGTARYTFPTQAQKDEAVKVDPVLAQVKVYDGAGFFTPGTYWEHCAGSTIPLDLAQAASRTKDPELLALVGGLGRAAAEEAGKLDGPVTTEGKWTFRASGEYIAMLVLLHRATGEEEYLSAARAMADRELLALQRVVQPEWWRLPERAALLNGLLELAAE